MCLIEFSELPTVRHEHRPQKVVGKMDLITVDHIKKIIPVEHTREAAEIDLTAQF